jgi:hypothetical protein
VMLLRIVFAHAMIINAARKFLLVFALWTLYSDSSTVHP